MKNKGKMMAEKIELQNEDRKSDVSRLGFIDSSDL